MIFECTHSASKHHSKAAGVLANYCVLPTSFCNGLRLSEGVEAINRWLATGDREVQVRVEKQKWSPGHVPSRLVIIPPAITVQARSRIDPYQVHPTQYSARNTCRYHLKFNSHNCRFSARALRSGRISTS